MAETSDINEIKNSVETTETKEMTVIEEPTETTDETTETTTEETTTASQNNNATTSPKTGYDGNLTLWLLFLGVSVAGMSGTFLYDKRRKYSR